MKALLLSEFNTPYKLVDIERPKPRRGEVLVKIAASGVNPLDLKIKTGRAAHARPKLPGVFGIDLAGTVEELGEGVDAFKPGDKVYGMTGGIAGVQGSLAEYAAVDADLLAIKPSTISMHEAAALPLIFITAWEGLVDRAKLREGQSVLVHGGAGGVGHIAVQIAKALGAKAFSTVDPSKNELIRQYGAVPIDYTTLSVDEYVAKYTDGEGFDVVFDTIGGATLDDSFKAIRQYTGHVVSILGWGTHSLAPLSFRGGTYSGVFTLYPLISGQGRKHHGEILHQAALLVDQGKIGVLTDPARYTLETIEEAHQSLDNKTAKGKVVITIGQG